jgi:hypothetical protein
MKRLLNPATTRTTLRKLALTFLCCTALMVLAASAQTRKQIKLNPGANTAANAAPNTAANNGPPPGAIKDLNGTAIPGGGNDTYQQYTVSFTAADISSTAITFAFREDPAFISFSNASVVDLAGNGTNLLVNGDFSQGTVGWTYSNQYGASSGGYVQASCGVGSTPTHVVNCWYDGAVQAYDAISQPIATVPGRNYQISFWVADNSGCVTYPNGVPTPISPCNFSDLSTNGDNSDTGGNGINVTVYAQAGLPPPNQTLTLTLLDSGTGTVADNGAALGVAGLGTCYEEGGVVTQNGTVSAAGTCTASYPIGSSVILTATPNVPVPTTPASTFGDSTATPPIPGWGGACTASAENPNQCNLTMNSSQSASAAFVLPGQTVTQTVNAGTQATFTYNGGYPNGTDYTVLLTSPSQVTASVTEITFATQHACNSIFIFPNSPFAGAQCFVSQNGGTGTAAVGYELTCPGYPGTNGTCGSDANATATFFATLGSDFSFNISDNSNPGLGEAPNKTLTYLGGNPLVGFLKYVGPDPLHPCTLNPGSTPVSMSNQISSFTYVDPGALPVKGTSSGTGSCWLVTYDTPDEVPTASITAPGNGQDYPLNSTQTATFTCTAVNNTLVSVGGQTAGAVGPYLTVNTCTLNDTFGAGTTPYPGTTPPTNTALGTNSTTNTVQVDTGTPGPHTLTAVVVDSATNTVTSSQVIYNVQGGSSTAVISSSNPSSYGQSVTFTANVTGVGTLTGTVQFAIDGSSFGPLVTLSGGSASSSSISLLTAGTHTVTATYSGDNSNSTSTGTLSQVVSQASQTITLSGVPSSAAYNSSFTVAATGGASGNPVTFTSSGVCSNVGATYTMTSSAGTCSVIANQAGNTNYSAAPQVTQFVNATGPLVSLTPTSINFGTAYLFNVNAAIVTVKNIGTSTVQISNVSLTLGSGTNEHDFSFLNFCPSTLAPGKNCFIIVFFFAGNVGTLSATLNIADNAPLSPQQVSLSATVINPQASLRPSSLNFGTIKVGQSSTQNVTLTNPGTTPLTITSVSVTGANAHDFVPSNACTSSLAPSANCTISVTFTPSARGSRSANLTVIDNAQKGRQNVSLSGNGGGD